MKAFIVCFGILTAATALSIEKIEQKPKDGYGIKKMEKPLHMKVDQSDEESLLKNKDITGLKKIQKPDSARVDAEKDAVVLDILEQDTDNGYTCPLCQQVFAAVEVYIKGHEASIPDVLEQVCNNLFSGHSSALMVCETIVKTQLKTIIDYIEKGADPQTACASLGLC